MQNLPDDVLGVIREYLPTKVIYVVNKSYFLSNYPKLIKEYTIKDAIFKKYISNIIRNDCALQFYILLENNFIQWNNSEKWVNNYSTYPNYAIFIKQRCIEQDSNKCRQILEKCLNECSSTKKKHKKIRIKNIKWSS